MTKRSRRRPKYLSTNIPEKPGLVISSSFDDEDDFDHSSMGNIIADRMGGTSDTTPDDDGSESSVFESLVVDSNFKKSKLNDKKSISENSTYLVLAETFFTLLPLIILTMVFAYSQKLHEVFTSPEWSVTAAIVFGQTIVKLIAGILEKNIPTQWQRVIFLISIFITLLLIPSVIILTLVYISETPSYGLVFMQILFFILSVFIYIFIGTGIERIKSRFTTPNL